MYQKILEENYLKFNSETKNNTEDNYKNQLRSNSFIK